MEVLGSAFDDLFEVASGPQGDADAGFQAAIADRYLIDKEIGQGGMGTVYLARDVRHNRTVAIKVISPEAVSGIGIPQFLKETRYVARLQHPHILPLYDSGEAAGCPFYVTPFIADGSLRDRLNRGSVPLDAVLRIADDVAQGLQHAHDHQVLHCDVKPENVLVTGSGRHLHAYVADFGIARAVHAEVREWGRHGEIDSSAGTPAYVSPEQASGETNLRPTSDVYSFGCVLFEMLAGRPPFHGSTTMETVARRFVENVPDASRFAPHVPRAISAAVRRAMALSPEERFDTPGALVEQLERAAISARSPARKVTARLLAGGGAIIRRLNPSKPSSRRVAFMDRLGQDLRYAVRSLLRRPAFAVIVLLTLAIGIGMNTAIFSVLYGVLFQPLPYERPEELVRVGRTQPEIATALLPISSPNYVDLEPQVQTLSVLEAETPASFVLSDDENPASFSGRRVTPGYLSLFGVAPQLGRTFEDADGVPGAAPVVVVSDGFWRSRLGANAHALGQTIRLDEAPHTIVGVMPSHFDVAGEQLWVPFQWSEEQIVNRGNNFLRLYGRLAPGVPIERAVTELHGLWTALGELNEASYDRSGMSAEPLQRVLVARSRGPLLVLGAAVGFVLLIACANVANLMLARSEARQREIAVRAALGAGRGRLARQFLTESALTAVLGGIVGIVVAIIGVRALLAAFGGEVPRADEVGINGAVLGFSLLISLLTGGLVGLVPALHARPDHGALKDGARGGTGRITWFRRGLVVGEMALALMLITGAGLMLKSFWRAMHSDIGFDPNNLTVASLWFPPSRYESASAQNDFATTLIDRLEAHPEISSAAFTSLVPIRNFGWNITRLSVTGDPERSATFVEFRRVQPEYFGTLAIPLVRGRMYTRQEVMDQNPVTVINRELARQLFGGELDPIGHRLNFGEGGIEVIGVVGDVRQFGTDRPPRATFYVGNFGASELMVRAALNPASAVSALRQVIAETDPTVSVIRIESMEDIIATSLGDRRFQLTLIAVFAAAALLLGAVGIYGVMAYTVQRQTREIGVRMALGAKRRDVLWLVLWRGGQLALAGIVIGAVGAFAVRQVVANMLFDVNPFDPIVYGGVSALLFVIGVAACWIPARRASSVAPTVALRYE
jgi:putative ABC transport system permease protein